MKTRGRIVLVVSLVAVVLTLSVTTAFAANAESTEKAGAGWWSSIWSVLTDGQKEQLSNEATEKLEQELADGKISQEQYDKAREAIQDGEIPFFGKFGRGGHGGRGEWTEEQKAAMEAMQSNWDGIKSRWNELTDEQRSEIYDLEDQKSNIDRQIIEKYLEFGVIDRETADSMRDALESRRSDMRENSRMPMPGGRGIGGKGFKGR